MHDMPNLGTGEIPNIVVDDFGYSCLPGGFTLENLGYPGLYGNVPYNMSAALNMQQHPYDSSMKAANNLDVFRKINALLDNTLDLGALGLNLAAQEQNKMSGLYPQMSRPVPPQYQQQAQPQTQAGVTFPQYSFESTQWNHPDALPYPSVSALPNSLENLLAGIGGVGFDQQQQHQQQLQQPQQYQQTPPQIDTYPGFHTFSMGSASSTGTLTPTGTSSIKTEFPKGPDIPVIQGAISNRTLEQLTESLSRPCRPIRGGEHKTDAPQNSNFVDGGIFSNPASPVDTQIVSGDTALTRLFNRSPSPSDSDTSGTSGIGSETSATSDTATVLADLMNTLNINQPNLFPQQQQQQQQPHYQQQPQQQQQHYQQQAQHPHQMQQQQLQQQLQQQQQQLTQMEILRALSQPPVAQQGQPPQQPPDLALLRRQDSTGPPLPDLSLPGFDVGGGNKLNLAALNPLFSTNADPYSIERAAKLYRNAATVCEATCTWSGQLPPRVYKNPTYSGKVFLGGVPWDITEAGLQGAFKSFGPMKIEWPGKDGKHPRYPPRAGYVYVLFESEKSVKSLLQACTHDFSNGGEYYFKISSRRMRSKEVQVIPWVLSDSNYVRQPSQRLDPSKTVFVGALHGVLTAEALANIMHDLFGNVVYAGIDTDKHKYPIGSGRVTFSSHKSYMKAVNAAFVEIKTPKFTKKIQVDPYLEDSLCSVCNIQQGPFFCRDLVCFRYYCRTCWQWTHAFETTRHHKPLMRNSRTSAAHTSVM